MPSDPSTAHDQKKGLLREVWARARSSLQLGLVLYVAGAIGGAIAYVDVISRGGPTDQPKELVAFLLFAFTDWEAQETMAMFMLLILSGVGIYIIYRVTHERRWDQTWMIFTVGALLPLFACWPPHLAIWEISAPELTTMSAPRWTAVCLACSIAQLIFGWQAWLLREHHYRRVFAGVRSGLVFFVIVYPVMLAIWILPALHEDWQAVVNGEVWALLGAAQLIVALTAGVGERKAVQREIQLDDLLRELHAAPPQETPAKASLAAKSLLRRGPHRKQSIHAPSLRSARRLDS